MVTATLSCPQSESEESSLRFAARLRQITDSDAAYWDYSGIKSNSNPLAYFQYPAMMVPRMQGDIIKAILDVFPNTKRTFDPFAGSGTILTESLTRGLSSIAVDINPMAILLCKVKAAGFRPELAREVLTEVLKESSKDSSTEIEIKYHNREKWFSKEVLEELSKVCRSIKSVESIEMRRLMWVAFAEAVRINSNSRTSTYKLHIREPEDVARRQSGVRDRLIASMTKVVDMYVENERVLTSTGSLLNGTFSKTATILNHDIREALPGRWADALISSPPYGDNHTTVTYGQHSFLPLCWIPLKDIDVSLEDELLLNTHSIDSASLGGLKDEIQRKRLVVTDKSDTLAFLLLEESLNADAKQRLVSFFFDLDTALGNAIQILRPGSPIVLTLGNRCVGGQRVRTDSIIQEMLEKRECRFIDTHNRAIPTKRMAHRNQSAGTMLTETLLVMRSSYR